MHRSHLHVVCIELLIDISGLFVTACECVMVLFLVASVGVSVLGMYRIVNFIIRPEPDSTG